MLTSEAGPGRDASKKSSVADVGIYYEKFELQGVLLISGVMPRQRTPDILNGGTYIRKYKILNVVREEDVHGRQIEHSRLDKGNTPDRGGEETANKKETIGALEVQVEAPRAAGHERCTRNGRGPSDAL